MLACSQVSYIWNRHEIAGDGRLIFIANVALGNGNTVGAIPYFLNGGASITTSITGFGADQILAARLITASGELIEVNQMHNADLLWAIRGAGQFFGLVTELTVKASPLSALGNDRGVIWTGSFVFPLDRAGEVAAVMEDLMDNSNYATAGLLMVMAPPPTRQPSVVVAARYTGNPQDAAAAYQPLYDLKPVAAPGGEVPIQNASDARSILGAKGDFKRFGVVGLHRFDPEAFLRTVDVWKEMIAQCPDAINSGFNFQWDSRPPRKSELGSAHSLQDIRYWQYVYTRFAHTLAPWVCRWPLLTANASQEQPHLAYGRTKPRCC